MNGWLATQMDDLMGHLLSSVIYRPKAYLTTDVNELQVYGETWFSNGLQHLLDCAPDVPTVTFGEIRPAPAYIKESFYFPSPYQPLSDTFARRYATYTQNHTVHGCRYRPFMGRSRATILLLHGWTGGEFRWEQRVLIPWLCRACGYTVVGLVQPYHGPRTPTAARYSGEYFLTSDVVQNLEACRQAVIDARAALNWLVETAGTPIGVLGISLGAFMTYLLLTVEGRPAFAVPMLGHGDMLDGPDKAALTRQIRRGLQAQGLRVDQWPHLVELLSVRGVRPKLDPARILPINARYDAIVTADKAERLFQAWGIPQVVWFEAGHFGVARVRSYRRSLHQFIEHWLAQPLPDND